MSTSPMNQILHALGRNDIPVPVTSDMMRAVLQTLDNMSGYISQLEEKITFLEMILTAVRTDISAMVLREVDQLRQDIAVAVNLESHQELHPPPNLDESTESDETQAA